MLIQRITVWYYVSSIFLFTLLLIISIYHDSKIVIELCIDQNQIYIRFVSKFVNYYFKGKSVEEDYRKRPNFSFLKIFFPVHKFEKNSI